MRLPLSSALLLPALLLGLSPARADDDEHEEREEHEAYERGGRSLRAPATPTPESALYAKECGSCHVAYPAALLPARSWQAIMDGLSDHYGDNAALDPTTTATLSAWLAGGAGDRLPGGPARGVARIPATETPLRITTLSWFRGEHDEIPASWVTGNPDVRSYSACGACHSGAATGRFDEGGVSIPGHGRWDD